MSDDPDPWEGTDAHPIASVDPEVDQLMRGLQLFEQLKNVDSAGVAFRAVGGLSKADLQAIVMFCVFNFRQAADDPDTYAAWSRASGPASRNLDVPRGDDP